MEHIIHSSVLTHLENTNILSDAGFVDDEFPSSTTVWVRLTRNPESMRECCFVLHNDQVSLIVGCAGPYQISDPSFRWWLYRKVSFTSDCTQLQEDLDNLIQLEQQWLMQFNQDKCEVLTITTRNPEYMSECCFVFHIDQASSIIGCGGPYQRP
jgi:hypothetical protein